jgi:ADP-heptose:LPS heptosyltransferase
MLLRLKKFIISTRIGRDVDVILRIMLSFIPRLHAIFSRNRKDSPDSFIFFLYGGIGDVILTLPLINSISSLGSTYVLCDRRICALKFLFPDTVNFIIYDKEALLFNTKKLRNKLHGINPVFIQTSPIFEAYLIGRLLRVNRSIGTILDFSHISSIGFKMETSIIETKSRIDTYNKIYTKIREEFDFLESPLELSYRLTREFKVIFNEFNNNYIVISPMKSEQWKMGKMDISQYARIADYFVKKYNYKVIFVGSKSERRHIESIIKITSEVGIMNLAGRTNIEDLASILYHSKFVIANDNGIAHLSAYLDLKILVMYMFSDPKVYSWNGDNYEYIFNNKEGCMPCVSVNKYPRDNYPPLCKNNLECNKSITSDNVIGKIHSLKWA